MRRLAIGLSCTLIALSACDSDDGPRSAAAPVDSRRLADSPAPLAALYRQGGELLDGGAESFKARLRRLRGYPVVVNKWASWCGPCRYELPFFGRQVAMRGKRVGFLGVNSNDNDADAADFLRELALPFPSYKDPDLAVAAEFDAVQAFPATAFYDRGGELAFVHQGAYASEAKLAEDIERYAR